MQSRGRERKNCAINIRSWSTLTIQCRSVAKGSCWKLKSTHNLNSVTITGMYSTGWPALLCPLSQWNSRSSSCLCSLVPVFYGEDSQQIFSLGLPKSDTIMWNLGNMGSGLCHAYNKHILLLILKVMTTWETLFTVNFS